MTYYVQSDSNGNINAYYTDDFFYPNGIPVTAIQITDQQWKDSVDNPGKYIVQNGSFILAPPPTDQEQLDDAKQSKKTSLSQDFETSIIQGFNSNADGTSRTFAIDQTAMTRWTGTLANINDGSITSVNLKDINGNRVTLDATQFKQMASDGFNFFQTQETKLWDAEDNVDAIQLANYSTVQDAINAVNAVTL